MSPRDLVVNVLAVLATGFCVPANSAIERIVPDLDKLVAPDATVEKLADGFEFAEGPVWIAGPDGGHLRFTDIPANRVMKWSPKDGVSVYLSQIAPLAVAVGPEPGANGLTLDPQGRLVLCEHANRRVARLEKDSVRI